MTRLAAAVAVLALNAFPLAVLPGAPITWLAAIALVVGGAGVGVLSVPLVTAGASISLVTYALALGIARPIADPLTATAFGATLVLAPALVHVAGRLGGAAVGAGVLAAQARQWLGIVAAGAVAAAGVMLGGAALAPALRGATLPIVVLAAALGAVLTAAGAIALVTAAREPTR